MVYLIHFSQKFKHCQHYIGFSQEDKFDGRMHYHKTNRGARLLRALNLAGIKWKVVRKWPGMDGNFERQLKKRKKAQQLCPVCRKVYTSLTDQQKSWISKMLSGAILPGETNFDKKQFREMNHLIEFNLAYHQTPDHTFCFHIPEAERDRIRKLLKLKS